MILFIISITVAMVVSFTCSVLEACLLSLSTTDIANISEKQPAAAKIWKNFKENIQRPIAVILVVNTLAHTIGASVAGAQFSKIWMTGSITAFSLIFSFAMIQWTEILPKTIGVRYNRSIASFVAVPLKVIIAVFSPIVYIIQVINRPFESKKKDTQQFDAVQDINILARFAALNDQISQDQATMLEQTIALANRKTEDIMVEKHDMKFLSTTMTLTQALIEAHIHHHTRLPLINEGNINDVLGYVNFKDIVSALQTNPKDPSLKGICRPILVVRSSDTLTELLNKLTKSYQHIALVKDDADKTAGIVTLEDIIEAIVGDINDEYDVLPTYFYQIADNRHIAGGGVTPEAINLAFGIAVPETVATLSDWLCSRIGKTPRAEEQYKTGLYTFIIRKVSRSRIFEVVIERNESM